MTATENSILLGAYGYHPLIFVPYSVTHTRVHHKEPIYRSQFCL